MGLKSFNPYTASRRFMTMLDKSEITKQTPEKSLVEPKKRSGGRNAHGEIAIWHRGGGHKKQYRVVDFRRDKDGHSGARWRPSSTTRTARRALALLHYADGEKRYILHPVGLEVGMTVQTGEGADILPGNALPIRLIPPGTQVHNLELYPGQGRAGGSRGGRLGAVAQQGRRSRAGEAAFGRSSQVLASDCMATVGQVGNLDHENVTYGKAGRTRWHGRSRRFAAWP